MVASPTPESSSEARETGSGAPDGDVRRERDEHPEPPQAPGIERRVLLTPLQRWGLPLLLLLPLLALLGLVDEARGEVSASEGFLRLQVDYPSRARAGVTTSLTATVWNDGAAELSGVYVTLPSDYLDAFAPFELLPAATTVSAASHRVFLGAVPAGGSRVVTALLTPSDYGRRSGSVSAASAAAPQPITTEFSTFTFP